MSAPAVSIVIVSRGRPEELARCLTAIGQLFYPNFEVVVVADPEGLDAINAWQHRIKRMPFADANISHARNLGIAQAAGEIVAFIDDDAVPEPTWLDQLVAGFSLQGVDCVGGYVRGRNGFSYQWRAREIAPGGRTSSIEAGSKAPFIPDLTKDHAVKTEGTNMAVRRDVLAQVGGFDPAYAFYMDETDLNMRLAKAGHVTAIAPLAQVHHSFAASSERRSDRVPRSLRNIGRSAAVFQRRHPSDIPIEAIFAQAQSEQRNRLLRHMVAGRLEPRDVSPVLESLLSGWKQGMTLDLNDLQPLPDSRVGFLKFDVAPPGDSFNLVGNVARKGEILRTAAKLSKGGNRVSVYLYSLLPKRHKLRYDPNGYWLQTGGITGKSIRTEPLRLAFSLKTRHTRELKRASVFRNHPSDTGDNNQFF